jgi:hypothetical protein
VRRLKIIEARELFDFALRHDLLDEDSADEGAVSCSTRT